MRVLFITAEAAPFAKVGGLGDVVAAGSLPSALRRLGVDARVMLPLYGTINREKFNIRHLLTFALPRPNGVAEVKVYTTERDGLPFYFIESWPFFWQEKDVYQDYDHDIPRFVFFNQAALAAAWHLGQVNDWTPDVLHVNDWHTGIIPFFVKESLTKGDLTWQKTRTVLSIHNMAYQGGFVSTWMMQQGIPPRDHPNLTALNLGDNLLAISIAYSDLVTTVSPRHAQELQHTYLGYGLDQLLRMRGDNILGILNGIDTVQFNPATDPHIRHNYDPTTFVEQRALNKAVLQTEVALALDPNIPIVGVVSRIVWQKGFDFAAPALHDLLESRKVQLVVLGTGEADLCDELEALQVAFPDQARVYITYDAGFAQRIYAGCDIFLMPSHYEPCGIGQMVAMRYGALPLVRDTGGLADTVENYDNAEGAHGTGFVFEAENSSELLQTLYLALETYIDRPQAWQRMQARAMQRDFSWQRSAEAYQTLYTTLLGG
ncbi:MAG: glycogen synthase [Phototrophicaceae bacterium]|jgi:starch synthase